MRASKRPKMQHRVAEDDEFQRGVEALRADIAAWTLEDVADRLAEIEKRWGVDTASDCFGASRVSLVCDALKRELAGIPDIATGPRSDSFNVNTTGLRVRRELDIVRVSMIRARCQAEEAPQEGAHTDLLVRISRLQECVHYVWLACIALNRVALTAHTNYAPMLNDDDLLMRFDTLASVDGQDLSPLHQVVLYVMEHIRLNNYKRCGEDCYAMVSTPEGRPTRAWKRVHSIRDLLLRLTTQDVSMTQMRNVLSRGDVIPNTVSYLTEVANWRFPDLTRDRRLVAFADGLYVTVSSVDGRITDRFVPHDQVDHHFGIGEEAAACRIFDSAFPHDARGTAGWRHISTPHLDSILDCQQLGVDVSRWLFVMLGRLLHDVGSLEGWQIVPYIKGTGDTGKSTIINAVAARFYDSHDVGRLDNNTEKQWCLSNLYDKLLFVAPEIKKDFKLSQCEFQKMISAEGVAIARKFKQPINLDKWTVPGILAGNELPGWVDNAGSISRRILVFSFERVVREKDTQLDSKLDKEIPRILVKANRAYLEMVRQIGHDDVWKHVPPYFRQQREEVASSCNPLEDFITSGKLEMNPRYKLPWSVFLAAFHSHELENSLARTALKPDMYRPILARHRLSRSGNEPHIYDGRQQTTTWVKGCQLLDDGSCSRGVLPT